MDRPRFSSAFLHPRYWPLWFGLGLLWLVVQLPYPVLLMLGRGLGALMYRLVGSRREIAARNLELCFPENSHRSRRRHSSCCCPSSPPVSCWAVATWPEANPCVSTI